MLHPTAKEILVGRITGLNSAISITEYMLTFGMKNIEIPEYYTSPGTEYYIGFGTGYEQGQKLRSLLKKDVSSEMSLSQKIKCLSFLLKKQETCRLVLSTQSFLDNTKYWKELEISKTIIDEIQNLLKENKIQRAVYKMLIYLKERFYLEALMEFYEVYLNLENARSRKKNNKEYEIGLELEKIKIEVQNWINKK
ncbi:hypothetical protein SAMN04487910_1852 [Aquimarina amphilecti]|uniref:Uncharacterized protein n=2 Tax=Aquimarina amphilecti TaxID=1038014 RepID=A0A1H7MU43_AQUAM|nr:hypothetical protein SAMN04487910_1852 [Aquimarina amphilecti]